MGKKRVLPSFPLFSAATMTDSATITSPIVNVSNLDNIGLQISWTGTPTGTIAVKGSVDGTNFYSWTPSPALTQPAGSTGAYLTAITNFPFPWLEVTYTNSSSTGALTIYVCGKDLN